MWRDVWASAMRGAGRWLKQGGCGGGLWGGGWRFGGCQQACTGVTPCQALLGPHQQNVGCQAAHWNRGGLLVSLLLLSTNFLARWSGSNPSGPAHSDALCHSITQNVLLVSRHVREVTGKINLTLNFFSDVIIKKTNQMSEIKWQKLNEGLARLTSKESVLMMVKVFVDNATFVLNFCVVELETS